MSVDDVAARIAGFDTPEAALATGSAAPFDAAEEYTRAPGLNATLVSFEHEWQGPSGERRYARVMLLPTLAPDGEIERFDGIIEELEPTATHDPVSSMKFVESLLEGLPNPVFVKDEDHRWVMLNDAFCGFMGRERRDLLGKSDGDFVPPDEAQVFWAKDDEVFAGAAANENEEQFTDSSGRTRVIMTRKSLHTDEHGRRLLLGVITDITALHEESKRANESLREQLRVKDQLVKVAESVPGVIYSFRLRPDGSACMPFSAPAVEDLFGISQDVLAQDMVPFFSKVHPDDRQRLNDGIAEAARTLSRWHDEYRYLHPRKGLRWIEGWSSPIVQSDGSILWHGYVTDVTQRKRDGEVLRQSEERFRSLIEKSSHMIMVLDAEGRFRFWSQGSVAALGWAPEEQWGRPVTKLIHDEDRERIGQVLAGLLSSPGEAVREALRYRHKDGTWRQVEVTARNLLHDPAVQGVIVNGRDVTEQRHLEDQVRQSQKLAGIGRLAGGVAHDFNNLLTIILSCAETLKDDFGAGSPAQAGLVDEIQAAGKRAAELTRQLLALARKQIIAPVPLDLNAVVRGSEKLLLRILGEDVDLVVNVQPALWTVRCDQGQVEQAILNLAINARDAMPGGGRLSIETTNVQIDERFVASHPFMRTGPHVRLTIRDTGVGMTPEAKAHVFEPFFTTKPQGKGTGLGLAMTYGIMKQNGGYIHVESDAGRGATFELYFPRIVDATVTAPAASTTTRRGTETILVVEDDPLVRKVILRSLMAVGYRVLAASSGREALEVAAREKGAFDLLLTDVIMPGLNGREVAGELRSRRPDLRVLYMSGYTQDVISQAGVLDSGIDFLSKPFTAALLLDRVQAVLDAH